MEQRRAGPDGDRELRALRHRYEAILGATPFILMEVDMDKVYTWANEAGLNFFGQDVIGKPASHFFVGEQDTYDVVQPLFEGYEDTIYVESLQRRKDGEERLLAWWCRQLKDEEGKPKGTLATARDVTDEKKASARLQRTHRCLNTLSECNQMLLRAQSEDELLAEGCRVLVEVGKYGAAWVALLEEDGGGRLRLAARFGLEDEFIPAVEALLENGEEGRGPLEAAMTQGQALVFHDIADSTWSGWRRIVEQTGCRSMAVLPLTVNEKCLGIVGVQAASLDALGQEEMKLLSELAGDIFYGIAALRQRAERRKAQQALREEERKLKTLMGNLPGIAYRSQNDRQRTMEFLGEGCREILEYEPQELVGNRHETFADLIHPEDRERAWDELRRAVGERTAFEIEYRARTKSGRERWLWEKGVGVPDGTGQVEALEGFILDITDRKRFLNELREREQYYRTILYGMQEDIALVDQDYRIVDINNSYLRSTGHSREDLVGRHCYEVSHGYVGPCGEHGEECLLQEVFSTGEKRSCVHEHKHVDGPTVVLDILLSPMKNSAGEVVQVVESMRDVTDLMATKTALEKSEQILRTIFEGSAEGIAVADVESRSCLFANPSLCEFLGYTCEELEGLDIGRIHPKESLDEIMTLFDTVAKGESLGASAIPCVRKDGSLVYADIACSRAKVDGRKCIVAFFTDRTEQRALEEQLLQSQKLEAVGTLAGGVAHDFNNILTLIVGRCELLSAKLRSDDPLFQGLADIRENGERAASLTNQLLAFSRKQTLQPKVLDLNDVVSRLEKMLGRLIGEDIEFVTVKGEDLWYVEADEAQMEQVIVNIAVNARDAMPDGGTLAIETANVELDGKYSRRHVDVAAGQYVRIAVSDTGIGMNERTKSQIFEPFFTTKELGRGTGLGLSTVYGIVKQSAGHIYVYSEEGMGTTFKIYLPRVDAESDRTTARDAEASIQGRGESILVVEDDPSLQSLCQGILEELSYNVSVASNGGEAILLVEEEGLRPDMVITDVVMPGMNGKTLADRLRKTHPDVKVLFMSGYTDSAIVHHGVLDPGTPFIHKPFGLEALGAKIREVFEGE